MPSEKKDFGGDLEAAEESGQPEILRNRHGSDEFVRFESIYGNYSIHELFK
jgi:hypothetical protein